MTAPLSLRIVRTFDAPRTEVFDAWTNPDSRVGWWGPAGFTAVSHDIDARPGGRFRMAMRSADGELHVNAGTYHEIVAPSRIVMTHGWEDADGKLGPETLITITFTEDDGTTRMVFEQTGFGSQGARDGHEGGWTEAFDSLAAALGR